jgi:hypothetical protein
LPCSPSSSGVEQRIENPRVGGSNPPSGTIFPVFYIFPARGLFGRSPALVRRSSATGKEKAGAALLPRLILP